MFNRKYKKILIIALVLIVVSTIYNVLSTKMAGYEYLPFTSTQMEIIPTGVEWEERSVIKDKEQIKKVLSLISDANLYSGTPIKCDIQSRDLQLLIRRNFAENDLSWMVCSDKEDTYLLPLLVEGIGNPVYRTDKQLMSILEEPF